MNKKLSMLLPVIATCGLLAGCGTDYYTKDKIGRASCRERV